MLSLFIDDSVSFLAMLTVYLKPSLFMHAHASFLTNFKFQAAVCCQGDLRPLREIQPAVNDTYMKMIQNNSLTMPKEFHTAAATNQFK